jgi:UDP-N-acetylglucosamine acyltransferase
VTDIHPSAVVAAGADLADDVSVGPYCTIGSQVRIGAGTRLVSHVVVEGETAIGEHCTIFPFASVGTQSQDLKYAGGRTRVEIGNRTTLREYVTVNSATQDGEITRVGSGCHIMAYAHIAHECVVGDGVIIANCGTLGGHVVLEDRAIIGGLTGVHQFVRVGAMSITGGCSKVVQDIPPYLMADGHPAAVRGVNKVGLERNQVPDGTIRALRQAYRMLYREGRKIDEAVARIRTELPTTPELTALVNFVMQSERGIAR